jgi:hypothetical protein
MSMLLHALLLFHPLWFPLFSGIGMAFFFKWLFELLTGKEVHNERQEQTLWWYSVGCGFWSVFIFLFLEVLMGFTIVPTYLEYLTRFVSILALAYVFNVYIMVPLTLLAVTVFVFLPLFLMTFFIQRKAKVLAMPTRTIVLYLFSASFVVFAVYLASFFFLNLTAKQASDRNWETFHRFNAHLKNICTQGFCPETEEQLAAFDKGSYEFLKLRTKTHYSYDKDTKNYHFFVQYTPKLVLESNKLSNFELYYLGSAGSIKNDWSVQHLKPLETFEDKPHHLFMNGMQLHDFWVGILNVFIK